MLESALQWPSESGPPGLPAVAPLPWRAAEPAAGTGTSQSLCLSPMHSSQATGLQQLRHRLVRCSAPPLQQLLRAAAHVTTVCMQMMCRLQSSGCMPVRHVSHPQARPHLHSSTLATQGMDHEVIVVRRIHCCRHTAQQRLHCHRLLQVRWQLCASNARQTLAKAPAWSDDLVLCKKRGPVSNVRQPTEAHACSGAHARRASAHLWQNAMTHSR